MNGFDTGIRALPVVKLECKNNLSARKDSAFVLTALRQEVASGFMLGPCNQLPSDWTNYRVSPLGVATHKYSGKKRLILDLSAPHNGEQPSINSLINKEEFSLSYITVDKAIGIIKQLGKYTWLSKFDIQSAFKLLPIRPDLFRFYCVKWDSLYYVFIRLPFGSTSSPKIFTTLSEAVHFIATTRLGVKYFLYLLDDFLCLTPPGEDAKKEMDLIMGLFNDLGIPLNTGKTEGPVYGLIYLGVLLRTDTMEARLPQNKIDRMVPMITAFLSKKACTQQQLLSLLGHLAYASKVVVGGRTYVARLIDLAYSVRSLHAYIKLTNDFKDDLHMWLVLLQCWDGVSMFHDEDIITSNDLELYTDSSSSVGFGAYYKTNDDFFLDTWDNHPYPVSDRSLSYLELYPIAASCLTWGKFWKGKKVHFLTDNEGLVAILNRGRSHCHHINSLLRRMVVVSTLFNFTFHAQWLPSKCNTESDLLSRGRLSSFQGMVPSARQVPCPHKRDIILSRDTLRLGQQQQQQQQQRQQQPTEISHLRPAP